VSVLLLCAFPSVLKRLFLFFCVSVYFRIGFLKTKKQLTRIYFFWRGNTGVWTQGLILITRWALYHLSSSTSQLAGILIDVAWVYRSNWEELTSWQYWICLCMNNEVSLHLVSSSLISFISFVFSSYRSCCISFWVGWMEKIFCN
jgi:hypothetical protein